MAAALATAGITDPHYPTLLREIAADVVTRGARTVGISGAQGSGKSTLAELLAICLAEESGQRVACLSIDDFYLTRSERQQRAAQIHPNFAVRGVPGTHDMGWLCQVRDALLAGQPAAVPRFDKSTDDRKPALENVAPPDLLVFEGWCWGAGPQPSEQLITPVNRFEADTDPDGTWRQAVNAALGSDDYQDAFNNDYRVFLAVPDWDAVLRWRWQQEQGLPGGPRLSADGVREFIQYYERLTRWMLKVMPAVVDRCIRLDDDHRVPG